MTAVQSGVSAPPLGDYRENCSTLVAGRDPTEVLGQTASKLADIVDKYSAEVLRARPFEGKWTPNEIIGHLTDSEWVYGYRLRLILSEANSTILGTQQDSWVASLRHNERAPADLVEIFRTLRAFQTLSIMILRMIPARTLGAPGPEYAKRFFQSLFASFPDLKSETKILMGEGDVAAIMWDLTGTYNGQSLWGKPVTGKSFSVRGLDILEIKDGKIFRDYCGLAEQFPKLFQQIGL